MFSVVRASTGRILTLALAKSINAETWVERNLLRKFCTSIENRLSNKPLFDNISVLESTDKLVHDDSDIAEHLNEDNRSALDTCIEDVSYISPPLPPSFNFATYADSSEILQKLMSLGVDFFKLDKKKVVPSYLLQLDFERDVQPYIEFLMRRNVPEDALGRFITINPFFFQHDLDNLEVRINYLESKRFTPNMIARIIGTNPFWLNYSTEEIDQALGYFQKEFELRGHQVRYLATKNPKLITREKKHLIVVTFSIREEMGFDKYECTKLLLKSPKLWHYARDTLKERFDVVHNEMGIPHWLIVKEPEILRSRPFRIRERHLFLKTLGKAQYDPKEGGYISPARLVRGNDAEFCREVAETSVETYNKFLKSL